MADLQETIGDVIRQERRERGLTLKELAERAIISVVYLGEIERGKKYPSPLVLEHLAEALELPVPDLLERVADALRGVRQPSMARAIGFTQPRPADPATSGAPRNSLDAFGEMTHIVELLEPARDSDAGEPEQALSIGLYLLPRRIA